MVRPGRQLEFTIEELDLSRAASAVPFWEACILKRLETADKEHLHMRCVFWRSQPPARSSSNPRQRQQLLE